MDNEIDDFNRRESYTRKVRTLSEDHSMNHSVHSDQPPFYKKKVRLDGDVILMEATWDQSRFLIIRQVIVTKEEDIIEDAVTIIMITITIDRICKNLKLKIIYIFSKNAKLKTDMLWKKCQSLYFNISNEKTNAKLTY